VKSGECSSALTAIVLLHCGCSAADVAAAAFAAALPCDAFAIDRRVVLQAVLLRENVAPCLCLCCWLAAVKKLPCESWHRV
jgi:hypothetical protein